MPCSLNCGIKYFLTVVPTLLFLGCKSKPTPESTVSGESKFPTRWLLCADTTLAFSAGSEGNVTRFQVHPAHSSRMTDRNSIKMVTDDREGLPAVLRLPSGRTRPQEC